MNGNMNMNMDRSSLGRMNTSIAFVSASSALGGLLSRKSSFVCGAHNVHNVRNVNVSRKVSQRTRTGVAVRMVSSPKTNSTPTTQIGVASGVGVGGGLQKSPAAAFAAAAELGASKAGQPLWKVFLLGIVAGAYIAVGGLLALCVGGAVPGLKEGNIGLSKLVLGAFGLPFGLTLVCTAGGELFTGNTALVTSAVLSGKANVGQLIGNWMVSFAGNFVGSLLVVELAMLTGCLAGGSVSSAIAIAGMKTGLPFATAFARGIGCNWLVCMGVYLSNAASDFMGKFWAIWLPVSAFVAMGFDHSVANMFFVPMGMRLGAHVGWKQFVVANLVPVTLGNIVGGALLVALVYFLAYGRSSKKVEG